MDTLPRCVAVDDHPKPGEVREAADADDADRKLASVLLCRVLGRVELVKVHQREGAQRPT